jgi:hypothetical protein
MGKGSEIMPKKRLTYSFVQLMTFAGFSALATFILSSSLVLCVAYQVEVSCSAKLCNLKISGSRMDTVALWSVGPKEAVTGPIK